MKVGKQKTLNNKVEHVETQNSATETTLREKHHSKHIGMHNGYYDDYFVHTPEKSVQANKNQSNFIELPII